jgi:hypothetical protein
MDCSRCIYWNGGYNAEVGNCTRYPKWEETDEDHFCGEFRAALVKQHFDEQASSLPLAKHYYNQLKDRRLAARERVEIITKLNKENKTLRDLYKKETGKTARIAKPKKDADNE